MDEKLVVEINSSGYKVFTSNVYVTWIIPGVVNLIINDRYIPFNFAENCFTMERKPLYCVEIRNQVYRHSVTVEGARGGWCVDTEDFGKWESIIFTNNVILIQQRRCNNAGKVVAIIEDKGLYTPEAQSFDDEENRFDCFRFETGGPLSKIWKVR